MRLMMLAGFGEPRAGFGHMSRTRADAHDVGQIWASVENQGRLRFMMLAGLGQARNTVGKIRRANARSVCRRVCA